MKNKYIIPLVAFLAVICIVHIMSIFGLKIETDIGKAIGIPVFFAPIFALLIMLTKEDDVNPRIKFLMKAFMAFVLFVYLFTLVMTFAVK